MSAKLFNRTDRSNYYFYSMSKLVLAVNNWCCARTKEQCIFEMDALLAFALNDPLLHEEHVQTICCMARYWSDKWRKVFNVL